MSMSHPLTLDDLWSLDMLGEVAVSPDGRRVAYVIISNNKAQNEYHSTIFLLHLDEHGHALSAPRRLTSGVKSDSSPSWSPDSRRLLFTSNREGDQRQLWLIDTDGGEPYKLTNMLNGVSEAAWSPDGQWIAFTAPVYSGDEDELLTGQKTLDDKAKQQREDEQRFGLRTIDEVWYRLDGNGFFSRFPQLFLMPAPSEHEYQSIDPETIRRLTNDKQSYYDLQWTPDSVEIGVITNATEPRDSLFLQDLWVIARETGEARMLTDHTLEIDCYVWSPDGKSALVVGAQDELLHGRGMQRLHLVTRYGNVGDRMLTLTPDLDNAACPVVRGGLGLPTSYRPQWSKDGQQVYFLVTEHGCVNLYQLDIVWRRVIRLTSDTLTSVIHLLPNEQAMLLAQATPDHFWELSRLPLPVGEDSEPEQLTHIYDRQMAEISWSRRERLTYQGANGDEIDGWLMYPVGAREGVRYPLLVYIHGGPHSAFGIARELLMEYCAAQGFAIFYCNPHGSTGSGEEFMRRVLGDWGGDDYQDIMRGVDVCIERGVADPERLVVTGYSYGGFMSMFTIGQTDRFKAAVPMAGISNLTTFVGTSDIGLWQVAQAKGYPWDSERAAYYRERSPLTYAPRVTTPTLILHPENDLRCPIEQSEQFYMTLKMLGKVPVEFVRAPQAWHGGRPKPSMWFAYWEKTLAWFKQYIEIRPEEYDLA